MTVDHVHHQLYTYNELFDIMVPAIVSSLSRHQAWGHGYALDETQGGGKDLGSDTTWIHECNVIFEVSLVPYSITNVKQWLWTDIRNLRCWQFLVDTTFIMVISTVIIMKLKYRRTCLAY
jgi:hypothetical protein